MASNSFISPEALLKHWQGHRRLTRRVIEAFPEDSFTTYSVGGMRPFSELALEMIEMASPGIKGFVSGDWRVDALSSYGWTIAGGTNEIQLNIIAERLLGLPRERKA